MIQTRKAMSNIKLYFFSKKSPRPVTRGVFFLTMSAFHVWRIFFKMGCVVLLYAKAFIMDLATRLNSRIQLTRPNPNIRATKYQFACKLTARTTPEAQHL